MAVIVLLCILQKYYRNISCTFFQTLLPYSISGPTSSATMVSTWLVCVSNCRKVNNFLGHLAMAYSSYQVLWKQIRWFKGWKWGTQRQHCDVTILLVFLLRKDSGLITFIQRWRNSSLDPISLVSHQIYCQVWMPVRNNFLLHGFSFL